MKWQISVLALLATLAAAAPAPQNQDGDFVNNAANNGDGVSDGQNYIRDDAVVLDVILPALGYSGGLTHPQGIAAAAKAEAAVLLTENGDGTYPMHEFLGWRSTK